MSSSAKQVKRPSGGKPSASAGGKPSSGGRGDRSQKTAVYAAKRARVEAVAALPSFLRGEDDDADMLPRGRAAVAPVSDEVKAAIASTKQDAGLFNTARVSAKPAKTDRKHMVDDDDDDNEDKAAAEAAQKRKDAKRGPLSEHDRIRAEVEAQVKADMATKKVHVLSFHSLSVGAVVLGAIRSISELDMVVSLPDGVIGFASLREVSDTMATIVDDYLAAGDAAADGDDTATDGDDSDTGSSGSRAAKKGLPELSAMYKVGQIVRCVVAKLTVIQENGSGRSFPRVELSLRPSLVNTHITAANVQKGAGLVGAVTSVEDRGYIIDFGIPNVSGFVAKTNLGPNSASRKLIKGQTVECVALAAASAENRVVAATCDPAIVARAGLTARLAENISIEAVKPGALVSGEIDKILPDGLLVRFLDFFVGTVSLAHLPEPVLAHGDLALDKKYRVGAAVVARVLYVNPTTKVIELSLTNSLVKRCAGTPLPEGLRVGTVVTDARVIRTTGDSGAYVDLTPYAARVAAEKAAAAAAAGFTNAAASNGTGDDAKASDAAAAARPVIAWLPLREMADTAPAGIPGAFRADARVTVRVSGCNPLDGYVLVTAKPSVLDCPVMTMDDVVAGKVYEVTIEAHSESMGIFVRFNPSVKGLLPIMHLRDIPNADGGLGKAAARFEIGSKHKLRVVSVDRERGRISLTAKHSMLETKLPVVATLAEVRTALAAAATAGKPLLVDGFIGSVTPKGVSVELYNRLYGYIPLAVMIRDGLLVEGQNPTKAYVRGQAVKARVIRTDEARQTLRISLKTTPSAEELQHLEAAHARARSGRASTAAAGPCPVVAGEWVTATVTGAAPALRTGANAGIVPSDAVLQVTVRKTSADASIAPVEVTGLLPAYHLTDHTSSPAHVQALYELHLARKTTFPLATVVSVRGGVPTLSVKPALLSWLAGPAFAAAADSSAGLFGAAAAAAPFQSVSSQFVTALAAAGVKVGAVSPRTIIDLATVAVHTHIVGVVRSVSSFGVYTQLGDGAVALAPMMALADSHISDAKQAFHVGQTVNAVVMSVKAAEGEASPARVSLSFRNSDIARSTETPFLERVFDIGYFSERALLAAHPEAWNKSATVAAAEAAEAEAVAEAEAESKAAQGAAGSDSESDEDEDGDDSEHKSEGEAMTDDAAPAAKAATTAVPVVGAVIARARVSKATSAALFLTLPAFPGYTAVALAPHHTSGSALAGRPAHGAEAACRVLNVDMQRRIVDVTFRPVLVDGAKKIAAEYAANAPTKDGDQEGTHTMPSKDRKVAKAAAIKAAAEAAARKNKRGLMLSPALAPSALALAPGATVHAEVLLVTRTHVVVNLPQHRQSIAAAVPYTANLRLSPQSLFQVGATLKATVRYTPPLVEAATAPANATGAKACEPLAEDVPRTLVLSLPVAAEVESRLGRRVMSDKSTFFDATVESNKIRPGMLLQVKPTAVNSTTHTLTVAFGPQGTAAGSIIGRIHLTDLLDADAVPPSDADLAAASAKKGAKKPTKKAAAAAATVSALARAQELVATDGLITARILSTFTLPPSESVRVYKTAAAAEAAAAAAIAAGEKATAAPSDEGNSTTMLVPRRVAYLSLRPADLALPATGTVGDRPVAIVVRPSLETLTVGSVLTAVVTRVPAEAASDQTAVAEGIEVELMPSVSARLGAAELAGVDEAANPAAAVAAVRAAAAALAVGDVVKVKVVANAHATVALDGDDSDDADNDDSDDETAEAKDAKVSKKAAVSASASRSRRHNRFFVRAALVHATLNPSATAGESTFTVPAGPVPHGKLVTSFAAFKKEGKDGSGSGDSANDNVVLAPNTVVKGKFRVFRRDLNRQYLRVALSSEAVAVIRAVEISDAFPADPLAKFDVGTVITELALLAVDPAAQDSRVTYIASLRASRIAALRSVAAAKSPAAAAEKLAALGLANPFAATATAAAADFDPFVFADVLARGDLVAGQLVRGYVEHTALKAGCFIQLSAFATGRAEIKELSDAFITDAPKRFPSGKLVELRVLAPPQPDSTSGPVDVTARRSHVSGANVRALQQLKPFDVVKGVVMRVIPSGVVIRLKHTTVNALARTSECTDTPKGETAPDLSGHYEPGDKVKAVVISTSPLTSRVMLGLRASLFEQAAKHKAGQAAAAEGKKKATAAKKLTAETEAAAIAMIDGDADADGGDVSSDDEFAVAADPKAKAATAAAQREAAAAAAKSQAAAAAKAKPAAIAAGEAVTESLFKALIAPARSAATASLAGISGNDEEEEELVPMSDDEDDAGAGAKRSREAKRAARERREREIELAERALMEDAVPTNADDFERVCLRTPNNSLNWVQYMAHELELSNVAKARALAERALTAIPVTEVQERWNVWVALMTLENMYGTVESLDAVVKRAQKMNAPVKVALELVRIYDNSTKVEKAQEVLAATAKRYGGEAGGDDALPIWYAWFTLMFKYELVDKAREVLAQALIKLPPKLHMSAITRFAQLEFSEPTGAPDRGRMMFEKFLAENPKRLDVWSQYADQEMKLLRRITARPDIKAGEVKKAKTRVRTLLSNLTAEAKWSVWTPRQMKFLFKKFVDFEEEFDGGKFTSAVQEKAKLYVTYLEARG